MTNDLTPKSAGTEVADPAAIAMLEQDAGQGAENTTSEDVALPFIKCAQKLSDEIDPDKPSAFIPGLREGDFFNNISKRIYPRETGFDFIPVYYIRKHLEWGAKRGDGFKGERDASVMANTVRDDKGRNVLQDGSGHVITVNATWFGFVVDRATGFIDAAVVSLTSTQLKKSRQLVYKLKNVRRARADGKGSYNPAIFANVLHITSVKESNDQGSWYGWVIDLATDLPEGVLSLPGGGEIYQQAKALYSLAKSGAVKTTAPDEQAEPVGGADEDEREDDPF